MKCNEAKLFLSAYLDSELEPTPSIEIARHLDCCAACRHRFAAEARLERALSLSLERQGDDAAALSRLETFVDAFGGQMATHTVRVKRTSLLAAAALAASAIAAAAGLYFAGLLGPAPEVPAAYDLAEEVHEHHLRFLAGTLMPVAESDSAPAANRIFSAGLPFPLEIRMPLPEDVAVAGALCCKFRGARTACLKLAAGDGDVSIFALAATELNAFPQTASHLANPGDSMLLRYQGYGMAMINQRGVVLMATGTLPQAALKDLLDDLFDPAR